MKSGGCWRTIIRQSKLTNLPDFPVVAFLSISFTHHTAILSQVKSYEERMFYILFASDYKVKTEELEQLMKDGLYNHQGQPHRNGALQIVPRPRIELGTKL